MSVREQIIDAGERTLRRIMAMPRRPCPIWRARSASRKPISTASSNRSRRSARLSAPNASTVSTNKSALAVDEGQDATDKLRRFAKTVTAVGVELFFRIGEAYEIAANASTEKWPATRGV